MPPAAPPNVVVRHLRKCYHGVEAVRGASFTLVPGEIFGLLGPNGAGKTTIVECLVGLRTPDSGEIEVCGVDALRQPAKVKQLIGVALQTSSLPDQITPREALRLFGSFYRKRAEPQGLLQRFGLVEKADHQVDTLSGGQRQRLALALAFVNEPVLVFLDEPTTGLDPQSRRELHTAIAQMREDGYTVLLTTHHLDEAESLCDRVAIIDRGSIVATGAPRELVAQSRSFQRVNLRTSAPIAPDRIAALPHIQDVTGGGGEWAFQTRDATAALGALAALLAEARIEILDLQVRKASLEEVFLNLTREQRP